MIPIIDVPRNRVVYYRSVFFLLQCIRSIQAVHALLSHNPGPILVKEALAVVVSREAVKVAVAQVRVTLYTEIKGKVCTCIRR